MSNQPTVDGTTITWTADKLKRLKGAYQQAVEATDDEFSFDGNQFVTNYAKYLIEYLEGQFA